MKTYEQFLNEKKGNKKDLLEVAKEFGEKYPEHAKFFMDLIDFYPDKNGFDERLISDYLDLDEEAADLTDDEILDEYWNPESEVYMIDMTVGNYPGDEIWPEFSNALCDAGW